jgi:hypothetical protein
MIERHHIKVGLPIDKRPPGEPGGPFGPPESREPTETNVLVESQKPTVPFGTVERPADQDELPDEVAPTHANLTLLFAELRTTHPEWSGIEVIAAVRKICPTANFRDVVIAER